MSNLAPRMIRFDDRVAVVTGAGAGLGRAYALLLAERGAKVVVNDLGGSTRGDGSSTNAADTVVEEIKKKGGIAAADYNSVVDGEKIIKTALDNFGKVDIVINNAGILRDKTFSRISDSDWDLVHNVHVRGAFKVTQAAWELFRKQKYGRVMFTASNAGILGNFGQANYSAAKMALVGLSNTLAIEGANYNIHSNVIVPTAASRLTENILPPDFFEQLKPELIAPVVAWLCHEDCEENGSIIESAAGWASKQIIVRGRGSVLRRSLAEPVSIEVVRDKWDKVVNVDNIDYLGSIQEETAGLTKYFSEMDGSSLDEDDSEVDFSDKYFATYKDCIMFALGIGASVKNPGDLKYLYEGHENFTAFPTQLIIPSMLAIMTSSKILNAIPNTSYELSQVLHGEQYLEIYKMLPMNEELRSTVEIIDVLDKGKNAVIISASKTYDQNNELVSYNEMACLVVNGGGFGGPKNSSKTVSTAEHPKCHPDATMVEGTSTSQAALYRLSGDLNPLHIDPNFALLGGFKEPILHGLASLGFAVRHVLLRYADNDPSLFKAVKVRFVKPVLPGDSLKTNMWRKGNRIYFQTEAVKAKDIVISGAYVDLHNVVDKQFSPPSGGNTLFNSPNFVEVIQEKLYLAKNLQGISYNCLIEVDDCGRKNSWIIHNGHISQITPSDCKDYDAVLKINNSDFTNMVTGRISAKDAEIQGKVSVQGDTQLAAVMLHLMAPEPKL